MEPRQHLYLVLNPNHSLVASQLEPADFVRHYVMGSARYFEGRLLFAEVDPDFRSPYFDIDGAYAALIPHPDGKPKATKFIKSYRVLENIDFEALGDLFVCDSQGDFVALKAGPIEPRNELDEMHIMLEINPVRFIVLTKYGFEDFSRFITAPENPKGAPKMFYTQLEFSVDEFMRDCEENPFVASYVPGIHPARLQGAISELRSTPGKKTKGISFNCPIDKISYKLLRNGFMFASQGMNRFYPLLPLDEVERVSYRFWKSM